jgi:hypothetical protein
MDSDDNCNWDAEVPSNTSNQSSGATACENPSNEPELMKLSNAAL